MAVRRMGREGMLVVGGGWDEVGEEDGLIGCLAGGWEVG